MFCYSNGFPDSLWIYTFQKSFNKVAYWFRSTKDRQPLTQKSGVHMILCSYGKAYMSGTRLKNHEPAVSEHSPETKQSTDFNRTEVIANVETYHPWIIRQAMKKIKHSYNFNHEDRYRWSIFSPLLLRTIQFPEHFLQLSFINHIVAPSRSASCSSVHSTISTSPA